MTYESARYAGPDRNKDLVFDRCSCRQDAKPVRAYRACSTTVIGHYPPPHKSSSVKIGNGNKRKRRGFFVECVIVQSGKAMHNLSWRVQNPCFADFGLSREEI